MAATVILPDDLYEKIRKEADQKGIKVEDYALDILTRQVTGKKENSEGYSQLRKVVQTLRLKDSQMSRREAEKLDQELRKIIKHRKLQFRSLEQAMSWSRGYPWGEDDPD